MQKTHRIRLNPTAEQEAAFMRAAGIARFAYNRALVESLRFRGHVLSARVTERAGHWYLTVVVDVTSTAANAPSASVGVDFGLCRFATLSTGEMVETQAALRKSEGKLKRLQRGLSRKKKGSGNWKRWKLRVARRHERVQHQRTDFLHKFTTNLANHFGTVCVEDLNLGGLCRTRLAKSFHDAGIGEAIRQLEYKQEWRGGLLQKVGRFFPSSKLYHVCLTVREAMALSERTWTCGSCGTYHDRDLNAAIDIVMEGLSLLAGSGYVGVSPVELLASADTSNGMGKPEAVKQELEGVAHDCTPER